MKLDVHPSKGFVVVIPNVSESDGSWKYDFAKMVNVSPLFGKHLFVKFQMLHRSFCGTFYLLVFPLVCDCLVRLCLICVEFEYNSAN